MKILFLTYSPSPYRVDFFEELGKLVDLTVCFEVSPEQDKIKNQRNESWYGNSSENYKKVFLKNKYIFKKYYSFDVIRIIKNNKFDLIIIGGYSSLTAMITMKYLKKHKIKFVLNTDGGFPQKNENIIAYKIKKHFISMADYYLSTGKNANEYLKYYGANEEKIFVYPFTTMKQNEISDTIVTEKEKSQLKEKLNLKNVITFISIGRFIPRKGMDILIKASKGLENIQVVIIGGKPPTDYTDLILKENIDNIRFIDFKHKIDLLEYMKASDVFVLATREDIWGLVINEALSMGIPVITTNKCGAGIELVKDNYNGFIINVDDVNELNKKMEYYIKNREQIEVQSINALNSIQDYTIENEALVHYEIIKKILND